MPIPYWRLSGFYFFYFAALGGFIPYWSLYLKDSGFNALQIGQLTALLAATKIISPNLWGWIADHTGRSLRVIRLTSFFAAFMFAGFLYFHGYLWLVSLTLAFSFFWNAALPQFEAATLFHLQQNPHYYSRIRLWGSVGFIVSVLGIGRLLETQPIAILPTVITGLLTAIWLITLTTPDAKPGKHKASAVGIAQIIKRPEVLAFLTVSMLLQIAHGPYYVFYSIYLKQLHYPATFIGLLWGLGVFAEIVLFVLMGRILKRVRLRVILLLSIFLAMLRWLLIAWYADNLYVLLGAQCLHAATFGSAHVTAMHLIHNYFGQQHQGKGQALYASMSFGLGGMLGSLYSGYYWQLLGAEIVFSIAAGCCVLAFVIAYAWVGRENAHKTRH
ncbi:MAG: MFS transporter [Methylococcales bacterium]